MLLQIIWSNTIIDCCSWSVVHMSTSMTPKITSCKWCKDINCIVDQFRSTIITSKFVNNNPYKIYLNSWPEWDSWVDFLRQMSFVPSIIRAIILYSKFKNMWFIFNYNIFNNTQRVITFTSWTNLYHNMSIWTLVFIYVFKLIGKATNWSWCVVESDSTILRP